MYFPPHFIFEIYLMSFLNLYDLIVNFNDVGCQILTLLKATGEEILLIESGGVFQASNHVTPLLRNVIEVEVVGVKIFNDAEGHGKGIESASGVLFLSLYVEIVLHFVLFMPVPFVDTPVDFPPELVMDIVVD